MPENWYFFGLSAGKIVLVLQGVGPGGQTKESDWHAARREAEKLNVNPETLFFLPLTWMRQSPYLMTVYQATVESFVAKSQS